MSEIKTEHHGHEISYAENQDIWRCWKLDLEAKTLSGLKDKINKIDAANRRINVPVLEISSWGGGENARPVNATLLDPDGKHAWLVFQEKVKVYGGHRTDTRRKKAEIAHLVEVCPATVAAVASWRAAATTEREAREATIAALAAIPRLTAERLRELGAASKEDGHG